MARGHFLPNGDWQAQGYVVPAAVFLVWKDQGEKIKRDIAATFAAIRAEREAERRHRAQAESAFRWCSNNLFPHVWKPAESEQSQ
jgi:hypothetical protein